VQKTFRDSNHNALGIFVSLMNNLRLAKDWPRCGCLGLPAGDIAEVSKSTAFFVRETPVVVIENSRFPIEFLRPPCTLGVGLTKRACSP
jgi:hypothetical protein